MKTALVLGAGGFIGSHLVKRLKSEGYWIRGVDLKFPEFNSSFNKSEADEFLIYDLRDPRNVEAVMRLQWDINSAPVLRLVEFTYLPAPFTVLKGFDEVYQLACDMGGAGYVFTGENDANIMRSALINLNVAYWAKEYQIGKMFYSSSACMYPQELQIENINWRDTNDIEYFALKESDAYPANPDSEYGWEKLFSERLYLAYQRNYNLNVRIARFHNIYGPQGTYKGGREKAPAAICRKVYEVNADMHGRMSIWGDGEQTRSFLYIDDCIDAVRLLMESDFREPINIGSEEMVSINQLVEIVKEIANKQYISVDHEQSNALGVRGRNSDNTLIHQVLNGWEPKYSLKEGLKLTYEWIHHEIEK